MIAFYLKFMIMHSLICGSDIFIKSSDSAIFQNLSNIKPSNFYLRIKKSKTCFLFIPFPLFLFSASYLCLSLRQEESPAAQ